MTTETTVGAYQEEAGLAFGASAAVCRECRSLPCACFAGDWRPHPNFYRPTVPKADEPPPEVLLERSQVVTDVALGEKIARYVAQRFGVHYEHLTGPSRTQGVTYYRHLAMYALRRRGFGLRTIGRVFHRDHSTVSEAVKKVRLLAGVDWRVRNDLQALRSVLSEPILQ